MQQIRFCVDGVGAEPLYNSDGEGLTALLKTHDFYEVDVHSREALDGERLNILKGTAPPRPFAGRLSGEPAEFLKEFCTKIERSAAELDSLYASGDLVPVKPYTCPRHAAERRVRIIFFLKVRDRGLGDFRRFI